MRKNYPSIDLSLYIMLSIEFQIWYHFLPEVFWFYLLFLFTFFNPYCQSCQSIAGLF